MRERISGKVGVDVGVEVERGNGALKWGVGAKCHECEGTVAVDSDLNFRASKTCC